MELAKPWEGLTHGKVIAETEVSILGVWPDDCDVLLLQGKGGAVRIDRPSLVNALRRNLDDPSIRLVHRVENSVTGRFTTTRLVWEPPLILRHWWGVRLGEVTATAEAMHSEVVCTPKRDISPGRRLDGIGGPDWYGKIMTYPDARARRAVPIGVGANALAKNPIKRGSIITQDDVTIDETTSVYRVRRMQDALFGSGEPHD